MMARKAEKPPDTVERQGVPTRKQPIKVIRFDLRRFREATLPNGTKTVSHNTRGNSR